MKYIPYGRQSIDDEDIQAVVNVLKSDFLTTGPTVAEFERKFAEFVDTRYAVSISNGTAALHAAVYAAGIQPGDEVITTPLTFAATANAILYCGGTPIFADVDLKTYNIDPESVKKPITSKTKAIIPVHFTGQAADIDAIHEIAAQYGLKVIEDAAHALGTEYKCKKIGSLSDMTTFSFHPVKHITTGEGGMVTTNNKELYQKLMMFRTHGITRDDSILVNSDEGGWFYEQQLLGYNYRLTDIQAALGISQLGKADKFIEIRRKYTKMYDEAFSKVKNVRIPYEADYSNSSWHIYVLRFDIERIGKTRIAIYNELKNKGLGVNVHYIPVHYHPYYQKLGYIKGICPVAEQLYEEIITIPLYPAMSEDDISYVIDCVKNVVG